MPRIRRELNPQSWKLTLDPEAFAQKWNERTWWHADGGQGPLTADELRSGPSMTPQEFVDWTVEWWEHELRDQTELNCIEFGWLPLFVTGFVAVILSDEAGLTGWIAVPIGIAVAAALAWPYRWLRKRGYLAFGDD